MRAFCFLFVLFVLGGCAHSYPGLQREQALYQAGTNSLAYAERFVLPYVPNPYREMAVAVVGAASAGLAAWNLSQQKRLKRLENGHFAGLRKGEKSPEPSVH